MKPIGIFNNALPGLSDGQQVQLQLDQFGRLITTAGSGSPGATGGAVQSVQRPEDGATLSRATVSMTGTSATLVSANAARTLVLVSNASANGAAVIDPTGGTAATDTGIPLVAGQTLSIVGKAAQSAMTQIGTNGQKLTVYTG
jgi:hypothetical protein